MTRDFVQELSVLAAERRDAEILERLMQTPTAPRLDEDDLPILTAALREGARRLNRRRRGVKLAELWKLQQDPEVQQWVACESALLAASEASARASGSTTYRAYFDALVNWYRAAEPMLPTAPLHRALAELSRLDLGEVPEREHLVGLIADIGRRGPLDDELASAIEQYGERPYLFPSPIEFVRVLLCLFALRAGNPGFDPIADGWLAKWCRYFGSDRLPKREAQRLLRRDKIHLHLGRMLSAGDILRGRYGGWRATVVLLAIKLDSLTFARWGWSRGWLDRPFVSLLRRLFRRFGGNWLRLAGDRPQEAVSPENGESRWGTAADVLVTRVQGGRGDIMMMRPALLRLAATLAAGRVVFATNRAYFGAFSTDDPIDLVDIERTAIDVASFGRWINLGEAFESRIEVSELPRIKTNRIDIFARVLGVPFPEEGEPRACPIRFTDACEAETAALVARHARPGLLNIGVQLRSAESYRDVPVLMEVVRRLADDANVFVFDSRPIPRNEADRFIAVDRQGLSIAMGMVTRMDALIAPDSAFIHLAGANDIPCLALFGPTGGAVRTRNYRSVRFFDRGATLDCVPCWRNENTPCRRSGSYESVCLTGMTAEMVLAAFDDLLRVTGLRDAPRRDTMGRHGLAAVPLLGG